MAGPLGTFLADDHRRLDDLLARSVRPDGTIDEALFEELRRGLLRHIALEEKLVFREARAVGGEDAVPEWRRLRIEHGALTSLLVPTPSAQLVRELQSILGPHDALEEDPGGAYARCDELLASRAARLVEDMRRYPEVKVAPHRDGPGVYRTAAEALAGSARQKAVRGR